MKWGCGTIFWLQPLSGHSRPSPAAASPVSQPSCRYDCCLAACRFLLESSDSLILLITLVRWLQCPRINIYQRLAYDLGAFQSWGKTGYTGYI